MLKIAIANLLHWANITTTIPKHGSLLEIPKRRLTFFEKNSLYHAIVPYNHVPESLKIMSSFEFEKSVRRFLLRKRRKYLRSPFA